MSGVFTRRRVLQAMLCTAPALWLAPGRAFSAGRTPERIVIMSWELTETLLALGHSPVGMSLPQWYSNTIVEPPLPPGVVDTGLLYQPNFEVLLELAPDLLILTHAHARLQPALARIAPTVAFGAYIGAREPYPALLEDTRQMAGVLNSSERAEALIEQTEQAFEEVRQRLDGQGETSVFIADVVDEHYVRVYGPGSLFDAVLQKIGVGNAAARAAAAEGGWVSNAAGFALVPLQRLANVPHTHLLLVGLVNARVRQALHDSLVWQAMPAVRQKRVGLLPVIAPFGGLFSLHRFALAVERALSPTANQESDVV